MWDMVTICKFSHTCSSRSTCEFKPPYLK